MSFACSSRVALRVLLQRPRIIERAHLRHKTRSTNGDRPHWQRVSLRSLDILLKIQHCSNTANVSLIEQRLSQRHTPEHLEARFGRGQSPKGSARSSRAAKVPA